MNGNIRNNRVQTAPMEREKPMTVKEVADQCHASRVSVLRWIRQGELKAYTTPGGHHRIRPEDFEAFVSRFGFPVERETLFGRSSGGLDIIRPVLTDTGGRQRPYSHRRPTRQRSSEPPIPSSPSKAWVFGTGEVMFRPIPSAMWVRITMFRW